MGRKESQENDHANAKTRYVKLHEDMQILSSKYNFAVMNTVQNKTKY